MVASLYAAPLLQAGGQPTDDASVINIAVDPGGSQDAIGLWVIWSQGPDAASQKPSSYAILKFNLTGSAAAGGLNWPLDTTIAKARLTLYSPTCLVQDSNVSVALYGMPDSFDNWTEASLPGFSATETAANSAATVLLKSGAEEGGIIPPAYFHWTDSGGGNFAAWLDSQKNTGTYPGVVTLMLKITGATANLGTGFEDRELLGCNSTSGKPMLHLADAQDPLAVNMSTFRSADSAVNWPLIAGLGALAAAVIGGLAVARRRATTH